MPEKVWASNKMRVHFSTAVRVGDMVYGSSGDFGPAPLTAVDVKTGTIAWQDRSFPKASFVYADGKFIVVDEDGNLALANFSPQGLKVVSRAPLLHNNAWTAPSVAGGRVYLRDRSTMMALDLR
jgi:outer membrane protein assembly factor BamB